MNTHKCAADYAIAQTVCAGCQWETECPTRGFPDSETAKRIRYNLAIADAITEYNRTPRPHSIAQIHRRRVAIDAAVRLLD